jgi:hypothetical protein
MVLDHCRREASRVDTNPFRVFPEKRLRSRLAHALQLDVLFQPIGWTKAQTGLKVYKPNPIWDVAPKGAYYRARKARSLLLPVVTGGFRAHISHDLERLAINIWHMPRKAFDGLCHRITARIAASAKADKQQKSPEATERWRSLTVNPLFTERVLWSNYNHRAGYTAGLCRLRLSYQLGSARYAHAKLRGSDLRSFYPSGYAEVYRLHDSVGV